MRTLPLRDARNALTLGTICFGRASSYGSLPKESLAWENYFPIFPNGVTTAPSLSLKKFLTR